MLIAQAVALALVLPAVGPQSVAEPAGRRLTALDEAAGWRILHGYDAGGRLARAPVHLSQGWTCDGAVLVHTGPASSARFERTWNRFELELRWSGAPDAYLEVRLGSEAAESPPPAVRIHPSAEVPSTTLEEVHHSRVALLPFENGWRRLRGLTDDTRRFRHVVDGGPWYVELQARGLVRLHELRVRPRDAPAETVALNWLEVVGGGEASWSEGRASIRLGGEHDRVVLSREIGDVLMEGVARAPSGSAATFILGASAGDPRKGERLRVPGMGREREVRIEAVGPRVRAWIDEVLALDAIGRGEPRGDVVLELEGPEGAELELRQLRLVRLGEHRWQEGLRRFVDAGVLGPGWERDPRRNSEGFVGAFGFHLPVLRRDFAMRMDVRSDDGPITVAFTTDGGAEPPRGGTGDVLDVSSAGWTWTPSEDVAPTDEQAWLRLLIVTDGDRLVILQNGETALDVRHPELGRAGRLGVRIEGTRKPTEALPRLLVRRLEVLARPGR